MTSDSGPKQNQELNYITIKNKYDDQKLTFALKLKEKKCWYVDVDSKNKNLIPVEFNRFFDNNGNYIN